MQCQWEELVKNTRCIRRYKFCGEDATHISYENNFRWCDKHFKILKESQPEFIERSGKYYSPIRELKLVRMK